MVPFCHLLAYSAAFWFGLTLCQPQLARPAAAAKRAGAAEAPCAVDERLQALVRLLWPQAQSVTVRGDRQGVSPFVSSRVVADGQTFHVKMARCVPRHADADFEREIRLARWAGEQHWAPDVVFADGATGVLVTTFFDDHLPGWHEGAQEPKLSAMLQFMAALHQSERQQRPQTVDVDGLLRPLDMLVAQALPVSAQAPEVHKNITALAAWVHAVAATLRGQCFFPARTHGDFHQNNFLYQAEGSLMVDWGGSTWADPMEELAYLSYYTDRGQSQLPALVALYGPGPNTSLERARAYLALYHGKLYLEEFLGLEPARAMSSANKLHYLWAFVQEDLAYFQASAAP